MNFTTPIEHIADRAASYAMPGIVVDGQDVDAVARAMEQAVACARSGEGPSLLEMKTYRYSGHSRSDRATYRLEGELDVWLKRDPIDLFARVLIEEGAIRAGDGGPSMKSKRVLSALNLPTGLSGTMRCRFPLTYHRHSHSRRGDFVQNPVDIFRGLRRSQMHGYALSSVRLQRSCV